MMETSACPSGTTCDDRAHFRYRLWPVDVPLPEAFRTGTWPGPRRLRQMRLWAWARGKGIIRMTHR